MSAELLPDAGIVEWERPLLSVVPEERADAELGLEELGSRIVGLAGRLASATCRWLLLVADFDARDGAHRFGLASTARWLGHYCGLSQRTAVEHVRVARALAAHPQLRQEMSLGRLSYSQVRAISRLTGRGDDQLIQELIMVAEYGTVRHLEDVVRGLRTVDDLTEPPAPDEREKVSHRWRPDSLWGLSARLDPENGALVQSAIDAVARAEQLTAAQALTRLAEIALAALAADPESPALGLRGHQLAAIQLHVEVARLPREQPEQPEDGGDGAAPRSRERGAQRPAGRIVEGPGLPDPVVLRLLCSGRIRTVVLDGEQQPLDLGRRNRVVSEKQYAALMLRHHRTCAHPGCDSRVNLEAHHVRHWIHGGKTNLDNLVVLCRAHHHAHHNGEFSIEALGRGRFRFRRADGATLPENVDPARYSPTRRPIEHDHSNVSDSAPTTRWDGARLDHEYAINTLAQNLTSVRTRRSQPSPPAKPHWDPWAIPA